MRYLKKCIYVVIMAVGIIILFGHTLLFDGGAKIYSQNRDCQGMCGDFNGDGRVNIPDCVWMYNYVLMGGPGPLPVLACGDANTDASVNISDMVMVINFVFFPGADPADDCSPGYWGSNGGDCCEYIGQGPALTDPNDPGVRDTVMVDNVNVLALPSQWLKFGVPVNLVNDEEIHAACLGFTFDTDVLTIDSVSYIGSCLENAWTQNDVPPDSNIGIIGFSDISGDYIDPGSCLLGTLWFSLAPNAPDQVIEIDSTSYGPAGDFLLSKTDGTHLIPVVVSGSITVGDGGQPEYQCGDVNCDEEVNISDAVWLINYIFVENAPGPCECKK